MKLCAISDLHEQFPKNIPECDVLIVAGDICPDGIGGRWARYDPTCQLKWFEDTFIPWADKQPAEFVIATWGNHDFCGETRMNAEYGAKTSVVSDGPVMINGKKFWLTPWSNKFMQWAFMKSEAELAEVYSKIPDDVDYLISHGPPKGFRDAYYDISTRTEEHVGSMSLWENILRIRPEAVFFGHIHSGYGHEEFEGINLFNVSVVNEAYQLVNEPTVVEV